VLVAALRGPGRRSFPADVLVFSDSMLMLFLLCRKLVVVVTVITPLRRNSKQNLQEIRR
jgi:hypothetical protein